MASRILLRVHTVSEPGEMIIMQQGRLTRSIHTLLVSSACSLIAITAIAQTAPDNTGANTRDRSKGAITADQQQETASDRDLVKRIRQSLVADKSLSTYAHNVKVVSVGGQVTLKGPVRSEEEKRTVAAKATDIAGPDHVSNEITVAPGTTPKSPKK